jgi:hypothetical protein
MIARACFYLPRKLKAIKSFTWNLRPNIIEHQDVTGGKVILTRL